jgi:hypothetical protein
VDVGSSYAARVDRCREVSYRGGWSVSPRWNHPVGGKFRERDQHESAITKPGVRDGEIRIVHGLVSVQEDVEIENPRPETRPAGFPSDNPLQALQARE